MKEYELYTSLLAPNLKPQNQFFLVESKNKHKAEIIANKITHSLYRYDQEEQKDQFLPFFNHSHILKDLLKFCDYILLAEKNDKLYVLLIEMKSGSNTDAPKQLEATDTFMRYIQDTADRISSANGYVFDRKKIATRKIILKPPIAKLQTNIKKSRGRIDWSAQSFTCESYFLPLSEICK